MNCQAYIVIVVIFTLVGELVPDSDLLVCLYPAWLSLAITIVLSCLSNNQQWPCTKVEGAGGLPLGQCTGQCSRAGFADHVKS